VYNEDGEIEGWLAEKGISSFDQLVLQLDGFVRDLVVGGAVREAFVAGDAMEVRMNPFAFWFGCPEEMREFVSEVVCFKCFASPLSGSAGGGTATLEDPACGAYGGGWLKNGRSEYRAYSKKHRATVEHYLAFASSHDMEACRSFRTTMEEWKRAIGSQRRSVAKSRWQ